MFSCFVSAVEIRAGELWICLILSKTDEEEEESDEDDMFGGGQKMSDKGGAEGSKSQCLFTLLSVLGPTIDSAAVVGGVIDALKRQM
jgi:hypothetical protein